MIIRKCARVLKFIEDKEKRVAFINFVVNGTLMRGLPLNQNLLDVNAEFLSAARTAPKYRLWSIRDEYPAMIRDEN